MALTLNNLVGFETGGLEEALATANSPTAETSVVRTGSYSLLCDGGDDYDIDPFIVADAGESYVVGFAFYSTGFPDEGAFFSARNTSAGLIWRLSFETSSGNPRLQLQDANNADIGNGITDLNTDQWYYLEIWFENLDPGDLTVHLDGVSEITVTSQDFVSATGDFGLYRMEGSSDPNDTYYDDFYCMSGATGTGDFLGPRTEVLGAYQNTAEDATDQGSTLVNGTWANVGQTPFSDGTVADYQSSPALAGHTICDEGTRAGPAGDAPGTITGAKYIHRMARTNGSSPTTLDKSYGNSGDGVTARDLASVLLVTFANFFEVSEAAGVVPTNSENFAFGMGQTGSGGRDVLAHEMCAMLLHTQPALSTTLADLNFPDQNYYLGPFGT